LLFTAIAHYLLKRLWKMQVEQIQRWLLQQHMQIQSNVYHHNTYNKRISTFFFCRWPLWYTLSHYGTHCIPPIWRIGGMQSIALSIYDSRSQNCAITCLDNKAYDQCYCQWILSLTAFIQFWKISITANQI